jgi:hypothetical protein
MEDIPQFLSCQLKYFLEYFSYEEVSIETVQS